MWRDGISVEDDDAEAAAGVAFALLFYLGRGLGRVSRESGRRNMCTYRYVA